MRLIKSHLRDLIAAKSALHYYQDRHGYVMQGRCSNKQCSHLSDIESLVRYLVDHPERLAGEDEVVVKREEVKWVRCSAEWLEESPDPTLSANAKNILTITNNWLKKENV